MPRIHRRPCLLLTITLLLFFTLLSLPSTPYTPSSSTFQAASSRISSALPKIDTTQHPWLNKLNPFRQPSHPPPRQKNDTDGDGSWWYADWKWLAMPFSSSVTLDENRALLPVLGERMTVYCYVDSTEEKEGDVRAAESELVLAWRRAWWAAGFRPVVLSTAEAVENPGYEELLRLGQTQQGEQKGINGRVREDLMRWLAWENMGGGVLMSGLLFPMGGRDDALLGFLRRGEFMNKEQTVIRYEGLGDGLYVGPKGAVSEVVKQALKSPKLREARSVADAVGVGEGGPFTTDKRPSGLALYSLETLEERYPSIATAIQTSRAAGLRQLRLLITAHLHATWRTLYPDGISVLRPEKRSYTPHLIRPAFDLAARLAHCSDSPLPDTCPPNVPVDECVPCDDSKPLKVTTAIEYVNSSKLFTIGTVPHPYTTTILSARRRAIDIPYIRRQAKRDVWITAVTRKLFKEEQISSTPRVLKLKEIVAAAESPLTENSSSGKGFTSLWLVAEADPVVADHELGYLFGFELPAQATFADTKLDMSNGGDFDSDKMAELVEHAKDLILRTNTGDDKKKGDIKSTEGERLLREAIEAWNLADTEAWKFVRAFLAREMVERRLWEEKERGYAGGIGADHFGEGEQAGKKEGGRRGWGRWFDRD
ncbi:uncharacterized protein CTHT_0007220 [Thermochaetoides thermophila DSM 1495]|uniref:Uncharacterized protein n=1 Tax=Chaetomium thermophilum (strain DSM 1495 / CBS 144.50 / IMI 039719) TaxID=759272 RepID=G0RYM5_CHATD|nr:hypothetical protein CTHT_0007220 [Thermochaetoides thermophila DSM 1495]EGS24011.1 hypothetical protein CTHT_0007220 [Thermochaetoides thermophila DSM 1495]